MECSVSAEGHEIRCKDTKNKQFIFQAPTEILVIEDEDDGVMMMMMMTLLERYPK